MPVFPIPPAALASLRAMQAELNKAEAYVAMGMNVTGAAAIDLDAGTITTPDEPPDQAHDAVSDAAPDTPDTPDTPA